MRRINVSRALAKTGKFSKDQKPARHSLLLAISSGSLCSGLRECFGCSGCVDSDDESS